MDDQVKNRYNSMFARICFPAWTNKTNLQQDMLFYKIHYPLQNKIHYPSIYINIYVLIIYPTFYSVIYLAILLAHHAY